MFLLPLALSVLATSPPRRLTFNANGTLSAPDGTPLLLRGFTFYYTLANENQANVTDEDRLVSSLLPGTNFARLVMVHWHDAPTKKVF